MLYSDHFGGCDMEGLVAGVLKSENPTVLRMRKELLWATQGSLWPVCCERATLGYSGITLASVLWKSYFGLLRDHFGQCAVKELSWATQGSLWPVCCERATLGYSGITLASVLWKS